MREQRKQGEIINDKPQTPNYPLPITHYPLPNAQCPMPNAQCPIPTINAARLADFSNFRLDDEQL
ncbi:hypothetical protein H6G27_06325 [Nostoc linckia FACHB-104]|nr:hypothetical protein [Nostoc linckia FACHB-104]